MKLLTDIYTVKNRVLVLPSPHKAHAGFCGLGTIIRVDNQSCILIRLDIGESIWITHESIA